LSCDGLTWVRWYDAFYEIYALDDVGEMGKAVQVAPTVFCALSKLEHHVQHAVTDQRAFGALGSVILRDACALATCSFGLLYSGSNMGFSEDFISTCSGIPPLVSGLLGSIPKSWRQRGSSMSGSTASSLQSALGSKSSLQAKKDCHKLTPELIKKQPNYLPGYDI